MQNETKSRTWTVYPPATRNKAFRLYISKKITLAEIAREVEVSPFTLTNWMTKYKWAEKRRQLAQRLEDDSIAEYRELVSQKKSIVARRHLDLSEKIDDKILDMIGEKEIKEIDLEDTAKIQNIARAAKASTEISARVVGLDHKAESGPGGSNLLVQVNVNPLPDNDDEDPESAPMFDGEEVADPEPEPIPDPDPF